MNAEHPQHCDNPLSKVILKRRIHTLVKQLHHIMHRDNYKARREYSLGAVELIWYYRALSSKVKK
jgi:hypothetical protein